MFRGAVRFGRWALVAGLLMASLATPTPADDSLSGDSVLGEKPGPTPIYANSRWIVWETKHYGDRMSRALRIHSKLYRQKVGEPEKEFLRESIASYNRHVATVLDDGTVLCDYSYQLEWLLPDQPAKKEQLTIQGAWAHIVAAWPDGLLLQRRMYDATLPVYFVPIAGGELKYDDKIQITDDEGLKVNSTPRFVRSGNRIAWNGIVFDLASKERKEISQAEGVYALAIDGDDLVLSEKDGCYLVSLADNSRRLIDKVGSSRLGGGRIFFLREGIGYFFAREGQDKDETKPIELKSLDLRDASAEPKALVAVEPPSSRIGPFHLDERQVWTPTDKGLMVWDGEAFQTVRWEAARPSE